VLRCDQTAPTLATGVRSTRYRSFSRCQRITGSAVRYIRRSSWYAETWCHHGWMPPANPASIHARASAGGFVARRNIGVPI
jgi:hypothetical protein